MADPIVKGNVATSEERVNIFQRIRQSLFFWPATGAITISVVLLIVLLVIFVPSWDEKKVADETKPDCSDFPWTNNRLPIAINPVDYDLTIHPNISQQVFEGKVVVDFEVKTATDFVVFHSKDLAIGSASFKNRLVKSWRTCNRLEQVAIFADRPYREGEEDSITLSFRSNLTRRFLRGLYLSNYIMTNGSQGQIAVTQFEPTDARRMFPCWDEPAFKAYFTVSIIRDPKMISLSNMPLASTNTNSSTGLSIDRFEKSLKMSTYLLALVVCDYPHNSTKASSENGSKEVVISVYAPSALLHHGGFALNLSKYGMEYLEKFFGLPYPLKKFDQIAVGEFGGGAMENWGLATFRESYLLYDPEKSSTQSQQMTARAVIHELAHQWFGNLVTMKWWNDLWLNEGFARFVENFGTSRLLPDWNHIATFLAHTTHQAMYLDGMNTTHPISVNATDFGEIMSLFDAITYDKGACVIYMIMNIVGEEQLRQGLQVYLKKYEYSNAEEEDLWRILTDYSSNMGDLTLPVVARSWTTQPGYPMVNVTYRNGTIRVEQTRLLYLKEMRNTATNAALWHIPITLITDSSADVTRFWLSTKSAEKELSLPAGVTWIKANINRTEYYRVLYERDNWKALSQQFVKNHSILNTVERALLLDDAFAFLRAGYLDVDTVFNLLEYFPQERNFAPADTVLGYLLDLDQQLIGTELYDRYRRYVKELLLPLYNNVGWSTHDAHETKLLQARILGAACRFDVGDCKTRATSRFVEWQKDQTAKITPDIFGLVCSEFVYSGSNNAWNDMWELHVKAKVPSEKETYLVSLAFAQQPSLLTLLLNMTLNEDLIRPSLVFTVGTQVAWNPVGRLLVWSHVKRHWKEITNLPKLGNLIKGAINFFSTQQDYDDVFNFFRDKKLGASASAVRETLEVVKINIQWRELNEKALDEWLKKKTP